jgi:import receptor subunit TOM22
MMVVLLHEKARQSYKAPWIWELISTYRRYLFLIRSKPGQLSVPQFFYHHSDMVKVQIVEEKDVDANSPYLSPSSSRTSSSVSLSSVDSALSADESFLDRLAALKDIIPPTTRHDISSRLSNTASWIKRGGKLAGNIVWVVTTSALLVALPLALSLEDEAKIVAQEKEMLEQQQGAQQASPGAIIPLSRFIDAFYQMLSPSMYPPPPGSNPNQPKSLVPPGF